MLQIDLEERQELNFGGIDTLSSPDQMPKYKSPEGQNFRSDPFGGITKRGGSVKLINTALNSGKQVQGIYEAKFRDLSSKLMAVAGNKIYEDVSGTWTNRTGGATITDSATNLSSMFICNNISIILFRANDTPLKMVATAASDVASLGGSPPAGKFGITFKRRAFIFGTVSDPNLGYYSAADNPESWTLGTDFLNFDADDGDIPTGAALQYDSLIVGKNNGVFRVEHTGTTPPFTLRQIAHGVGIGPASHQGIQVIDDDDTVVYLGTDDFYEIVGDVVRPIVSAEGGENQVSSTFKKGSDIKNYLKTLNRSRFQYTTSGIFKEFNEVWWSLSSGSSSTNDRIIVLNYKTRQWFVFVGILANYIANRKSSGINQLITGDYSGLVHIQDEGDSDGAELNQTYSDGGSDAPLGSLSSNDYISQGFTPNSSDTLLEVRVKLKTTGSPTGRIYAYLYSNSSGSPGTLLATSPTVLEATGIQSSYGYHGFRFSYAVTSGTVYHLVLFNNTVDASNYVNAEYDGSAPSYSGGQANTSANGTSWSAQSWDLTFEAYIGSTAISMYRYTPWLTCGTPTSVLKLIRFIKIALLNTGGWNIGVSFRTDFNTAWSTEVELSCSGGAQLGVDWVLGSSTLGSIEAREHEINIARMCRRIQFRFRNVNANQPVSILGYILYGKSLGRNIKGRTSS